MIRAADLEKSVEKGLLVSAGALGAAACSLVVRGLADDQATPKTVREILRQLA